MAEIGVVGVAAIVSAVAAAGGAGYAVAAGERSNRVQKRGLQRQKEAQQTAEARAVSDSQRAEAAQRAANRDAPDVTTSLNQASTSSAMLTGPGGVDVSKLRFGTKKLLGE